MKKVFFVLIIFMAIIQACQQKTLPTITTRTTEPSKPVSVVVDVKPDIGIGKIIFTNRCSRCHVPLNLFNLLHSDGMVYYQ